jgi:hypothetical protein
MAERRFRREIPHARPSSGHKKFRGQDPDIPAILHGHITSLHRRSPLGSPMAAIDGFLILSLSSHLPVFDNGILAHGELAAARSYGQGRVRPGPIYTPRAFGWTGARTVDRAEDSGFCFAGADKRRVKDLTVGPARK